MSYRAELRSRIHVTEQERRRADVAADLQRRAYARLAKRTVGAAGPHL